MKIAFSKPPFWGDENTLKELVRIIPMGRIVEAPDAVGTVMQLSFDLADYVTGQVTTVDGEVMS